MNVVVVESPAKAKTINKYLGRDFTVLASYGHVRDLPAKDGSVRPDEDFAMSWEVADRAEQRLKEIAKAVKGADHLYLATDPDREGEAISWHVREILRQRKALEGVDVKRVVFNEVTKSAVQDAFKHPREINKELVDAYLARRALDYLVGFTLSPVLWRKLPGSRSAGRVQSVALRLITEREAEIEAFKPREYWSVEVEFKTAEGQTFTARLTHLDGKRLDKFDLDSEAKAKAAVAAILAEPGFSVASIEKKQVRRHPPPPFTTSTLQQESSRKLGLGAQRTMRIAQRLYEGVDIGGEAVGLITYMRTDGVTLSGEAIASAREMIGQNYGREYVPAQPRVYKTAAKNAQEAHEAIRPTDLHRRPEQVASHLDPDERRLYDLVWKRAVASQMESALLDQVAVDIAGPGDRTVLRATGSTIVFDGFLTLYHEDADDEDESDENRRLPPMTEHAALARGEVKPEQHFTQPPPRYSEASLVKKLEELGIGRPSTYASIIQVLQDRKYVRLEKRRFIPEDRGRIVTAFLTNFFERYVEYGFTADLENQLDEISDGKTDWKKVLADFWRDFSSAIDGTKNLRGQEVVSALDEALGPHFFPIGPDGKDPRQCPACGNGRLGIKLGKFGAFIGCSNYPNCKMTRRLSLELASGSGEAGSDFAGPRELGTDPATNLPVSVRKGPYGVYVQLGVAENGEKPKRVSLPKGMSPQEITIDAALKLLSLPRDIGKHPEDGEPVTAGLGRFGPYIKHGKIYRSLPAEDDVITIGLNRAVALLAEPSKGRRRGPDPIRVVGKHPADGADITLFKGRYGPYVSHGGIYATLPRDIEPEALTLEEAVRLLAERAEKAGASGKRRRKAAKPAAEKPAAPKSKTERTKKRAKSAKPQSKPAAEENEPPARRAKRAAAG
ncbi:MAG TPA: type I DNA topoisomerase [Stellaceae bacterium]|nr:type I DNA topoisomerase [Stellaceae bacterium]